MMALHLGDCLDVLRTLPVDSVDAVVTDPPAGVSFMQAGWDTFPLRDRGDLPGGSLPKQTPHKHGRGFANGMTYDKSASARNAFLAFLTPALAECLRVARPGAVALVWALPRTSHWTGTAIEDAGWQIIDVVTHLTGQGFPKSKNVSKALRDSNRACLCQTDVLSSVHDTTQKTGPDLSTVRPGISAEEQANKGTGEVPVLRPSVLLEMEGDGPGNSSSLAGNRGKGEVWVDARSSGIVPGEDERPEQPGLEGRDNVQAKQGELYRSEVRPLSAGVSGDGEGGRVRDGASACDGPSSQKATRTKRSRTSPGPRHSEQSVPQSGTVAEQWDAQGCGVWPICPRCGKPIVPDGLGTALKPAAKFWFLARKPCVGSITENVLRHGTGALNIDACRIGVETTKTNGWKCGGEQVYGGGKGFASPAFRGTEHVGRWPAHVTLDDEAAALLDAQSGESTSAGGRAGGHLGGNIYGRFEDMVRANAGGLGDTGGASRFFAILPADSHCILCDMPYDGPVTKNTIGSRLCDASGVRNNSCQSNPAGGFARPDVPANGPPGNAGKEHLQPTLAQGAASDLTTSPETIQCTALESAAQKLVAKIALNARAAASLCGSCATVFALALVEIRRSGSSNAASAVIPDSMPDFKSYFLIRNLVRFVATPDGTATIPTIASLSKLFGSVRHVIDDFTKWGRSEARESTDSAPLRHLYCPKADKADRGLGNAHPTVKSTALMRWLVRLACPGGGTVLDCFMGSGSTGVAAILEGRRFLGIERDPQYFAIAEQRIRAAAEADRQSLFPLADAPPAPASPPDLFAEDQP